MIFNKSSFSLSNDIILSVAEKLPEYPSANFLLSNYYSLNKNYFNYDNDNLVVLKDIICDIKMYANPFRMSNGSAFVSTYPNIRLVVERNDTAITMINYNFNSSIQPMIERKNLQFRKDDIIKCYVRSVGGQIHSIGGYLMSLSEQQ